MEQTLAQAGVQSPEFSNGRIRVARSGQDRELRWFLAAVTVVSVVALYYLQLDWLKLISRLPELGKTFGLLALLDFHDFGLTLEAFLQTVAITVLSTIYSVLLGLVLAAFGARNLMKNKVVTYGLSAFFTFLRAVPTPVWVLLGLVCLGLGPAAGIVGLCVHATAFFARAFTQSFEDVPEEVIEALEATGASKLHIFLSAVLPAAASQIMAWTGLRFEFFRIGDPGYDRRWRHRFCNRQ
jgi:phosphonate transport system permease protein